MRTSLKASLALAVAIVLAMGTTGCKSGFQMRNPFSKEPKASSGEMPSELDELDDLTPPPENYTTSDSKERSKSSDSLVQRGKYGEEEEESTEIESSSEKYVAVEDASALEKRIEAVDATASTASYETEVALSSAQTSVPQTFADEQVASVATPSEPQTYATWDQAQRASSVSSTPSELDNFPRDSSPTNAFASNVPQNVPESVSFAKVGSASPEPEFEFPAVQPFPTNDVDFPPARSFAKTNNASVGDFPSVGTDVNNFATEQTEFPTASFGYDGASQVANVAQPPKVAMNYDPTANQMKNESATSFGSATSFPTDSDPYSGIIYEPQTTSSGAFPTANSSLY